MPVVRILLVEDFEPFRRFAGSLLQQSLSVEVIEASDGLEGVQKARELQPDLILMDIGLPKLNGIEAAKRILTFAPQAKLLFVSQEFDSDVVQAALNLGARGFIHKSFAFSDLLPAIQAVVAGARVVGNGLEFNQDTDARHRHAVQFYSAKEVFISKITKFIANSLTTADGVIVLATKAHREGLTEGLRATGCDLESAIQRGTYISLDAADTLSTVMVDGMPDPALFSEGLHSLIVSIAKASETEHPHIEIFGECAGLLHARGNTKGAVTLEKIGTDLAQTHDLNILCAYPWLHSAGDEDAFKSICAEHEAVHFR